LLSPFWVLVEHELDYWLRRRFKRNDKKMWEKLLDERGPLRSFAAKITIGHAFGIYDAKVDHDLNIVRTIRNAFAHSKKLLDFDDKLLVPELLSAHCLDMKLKKNYKRTQPFNWAKLPTFLSA
jgi:DNA-binding MltR family transcriptional regulator